MMTIEKLLMENSDDLLGFFLAVYLFGSALTMRSPTDLDLLLVYSSAADLDTVTNEVRKTRDALSMTFEGMIVDLTVLSNTESLATDFVRSIPDAVRVR